MLAGFTLTVRVNEGQLDVTVATPHSYRNNTQGLLGVFNGDPTDDLMTPSGQLLPSTSSEETIFDNFGELCKSCSVIAWCHVKP